VIGAGRWQRLLKPLRPLRVVIDARMADGASGGVQQWVIGLAAALSQLDSGNERYLFLVNEGQGDWLRPHLGGPCRIVVQPAALPAVTAGPAAAGGGSGGRAGQRPRVGLLRRLARSARRRVTGRKPQPASRLSPFERSVRHIGADVVHFPRQSASATSVPNIYQPWDLQHRHLPEFFSIEAREHRDKVYRAFCANASLVVVATTWVKEDVAAQYGIQPERIAVVNPPPVTFAYVPPTPAQEAAIVERLALPARFAFYPALAWGHKNHERLFEALRRLRDRGILVPLVCSGHLNERHPALVERAGDLGVGDQVSFSGFLSEAEIQVVYRRATMLVFPSLYEGWGFPIVEAFAADLPVTCSNVTSLPALVGDAAVIFDPLDPDAIAASIERLWVDAGLREALVERGRMRLRRLDWRSTAETMRAHYRRIAGRRLSAAELLLLDAEPLV
jgi:glycosyltransferase involved in cell wall biosynthesis